ncbi:uncharacterized protein AMSG_03332 [Thecamonas trahens ATCC 50062]|uniref:Endonuclease III homolog n=1 Tax=Thecamonas trahens ATCC 50062 TaxID=461836 RepID=A0A0L0D469_THETB|nr:hypothetical protein AMSG_03332 [Thecamonas trahens ATCC 50062]KNC46901.1 hypothetical protein AMSG_03332 [Thecamonas trahens ATCC 50062]|eukprot:XP_013760174.1 hypothetical protein AMSG_03332 [Thecamonas trahens ATCC 50062]
MVRKSPRRAAPASAVSSASVQTVKRSRKRRLSTAALVLEVEEPSDESEGEGKEGKKAAATAGKSKQRKKPVATKDDEPPAQWAEVYRRIEEMRAKEDAPVDTMGCERAGDTAAVPEVFRFQTLVALMLSSQTKDEITHDAIGRLNEGLPGGLTPQAVVDAEPSHINELIRRVGFHNRKTGYLQKAAAIILDEYGGDIPPTVETLVKLPGVGMKMAMLAMQCAWFINSGIGVDVHVHRIANRLGWVNKTKNPEATRIELEAWLPKDKWGPINPLLVGFGQTVCRPVGPHCDRCTASDLCPSAFKSARKKQRR